MTVEFIISAVRPEQFPRAEFPEVAFLGRSNVGKSSLLNRLVGCKAVARVSSRPGATQAINFYKVDGRLHFVDLPGYGFAKVPKGKMDSWQILAETYLAERATLVLCCVILDARRGLMDQDLELRQWLDYHGRRSLVIATKTDKWRTQSERHHGLAALRRDADVKPVLFSAVTGQGAREIWQAITRVHNLP